jgi:glycosyltransferase involved in cell wall biosynthesis
MSKKLFLYMSSAKHNAYRNLVANAPDGFEFAESEFMAPSLVRAMQSMHPGHSGGARRLISALQSFLSPYYNHAHIRLNRPKVREFRSDRYDLVHSGQSLLDTTVPYVVDFEHATAFAGYNQYALRRPGFVRALERILQHNKLMKLLCWSDAAGKSLTNFVKCGEVAQKLETVYPVMAPAKRVPRTSSSFNFLFIGNSFYAKGGYESLLAFEKLGGRYDCHFTAIGNIPSEIFARFENNKKITLLQKVPYAKVVEFYSNSDVFVFPTHYDTYGFVIPEALSFGLPVISVDDFSTPELVQHGRTGLLIKTHFSSFSDDFGYVTPTLQELSKKRLHACKNPPGWYIELLAEAMLRMMTDSNFRKACSVNAVQETTEGKFSPARSKAQLKLIYENALRVQ